MALDGFSIVMALAIWLIPMAVIGIVLYVIIRFAVKHGIRSYNSEAARPPEPGNEGPLA